MAANNIPNLQEPGWQMLARSDGEAEKPASLFREYGYQVPHVPQCECHRFSLGDALYFATAYKNAELVERLLDDGVRIANWTSYPWIKDDDVMRGLYVTKHTHSIMTN
jgi:hypothetical protein